MGLVFGMGFGELVVLVIVAIVVIGPKDLPKVLKKLGQWSGKLRRMAGDMRSQSGIDDVLREGDLGRDIAEIRKLARGEIESVSRDMRVDAITTTGTTVPEPSYGGTSAYGGTSGAYHPDPYLSSRYVSEDREHPMVGPDGFDAMPDSSYVHSASFPRSALDRDPLYRTGSADGVVPDDPPEEAAASDDPPAESTGEESTRDESASENGARDESTSENGTRDADPAPATATASTEAEPPAAEKAIS